MIPFSARLPLFLPVLIGCGVAMYFGQSGPTPFWPYALVAILSAAAVVRYWDHSWLRLVCAAVVAVCVGASASAIRLQIVEAPVLREPIFFKMITGTVEDIQHQENKTKLYLRDVTVETLAPEDTPKRLSISIKHLPANVQIGARIEIPAMLFPPPTPVLPKAYDFARMFYFEQLGAVGFSPRQPTLINSPLATYHSPLTSLRLSISNHLVAQMGEEAGTVASALMVGEQSRVPEEISESMRASGIYHILSISGLHMALATGMIFFAVRLLLVMIPHAALFWPNKKIAAIAALVAGFAYLMLAGAPMPAVRSYIMVACVLVAVLVDRKGISMYSLGWAAAIILLVAPESLFTASFQLSFAATLAIVALYERFGSVLYQMEVGVVRRVTLYFFALMATSLAASLYTTPLAITHFNRVAMYGVLANMMIVPLSSIIIMPAAMLTFLLMPLGLEAPALYALKTGIEWMLALSRFVEHVPYANITLPPPTNVGFMLMVAGGIWLALLVTRLRWFGLVMIASGLATITLFTPYDLIVSDDAKRIAYRSEQGQWVMLRGEVDSFEAEIWLRSQGEEIMLSRKQALSAVPELRCDKTSCMVLRGEKMMVALTKKNTDDLCQSGADILITDRYLHCDHIPTIIDRAFVETHGATGLRFDQDNITINTTEASRGNWPWVLPPYTKVRSIEYAG